MRKLVFIANIRTVIIGPNGPPLFQAEGTDVSRVIRLPAVLAVTAGHGGRGGG